MAAKRKPHWSQKLVAMDACSKAVRWARRQPSLAVAWRRCTHGEWMAWLLYEKVPEAWYGLSGLLWVQTEDESVRAFGSTKAHADALREIYPTITSTGIRL